MGSERRASAAVVDVVGAGTSVAAGDESRATAAHAERPVYEEVPLDDFDFVQDDELYYYSCPCGDLFEISPAQLANGETIARCPSCSLTVRVLLPDDWSRPELPLQ